MSLTVSNLSAAYSRIEVCHDVSLQVGEAEFLVVLGMNGAGKSSLLGAIAGSVESTGTILVDDARMDRLPARERAKRGLAFVPEGRRNLFPALTVEENLTLGLRLLDRPDREQMRAQLHELFPILARRGTQLSGMLSGGEQQMLALAVAMARRPRVLLLDEPSQGLAPAVLFEIADAIRKSRALGLALVLAEQNQAFARSLGDRVVVLHNGELQSDAPDI